MLTHSANSVIVIIILLLLVVLFIIITEQRGSNSRGKGLSVASTHCQRFWRSHFLSLLLEVDVRMWMWNLRRGNRSLAPSHCPDRDERAQVNSLFLETAWNSVGFFDLISSLSPGHQKFKEFLFFYCNSLEGQLIPSGTFRTFIRFFEKQNWQHWPKKAFLCSRGLRSERRKLFLSQKVSFIGVLDGISTQNTVLKSAYDSVAFPPAFRLAWDLWNFFFFFSFILFLNFT